MHQVLTGQIAELRADQDAHPVRKAHAIAQLLAGLLVLAEQIEQRRADQNFTVQWKAEMIDQLTSYAHGVIAEQIETLTANRDLDPIKKARAIARLGSEEFRLRALRVRLAAEALSSFDLGAYLEKALRERRPEFERRKRYLLEKSAEALAETSTAEPNGRAENPSPGGSVAAGC